jgi:DNA-binding NarL/FixJ family response regulator
MGAARLLLAIDERTLVLIESQMLPDDLVKALESGRWLPPEALAQQCSGGLRAARLGCWVVATPVEQPEQVGDLPQPAPISPRQHQVLIGLAAGLTTSQIAHHLGITIHTVNKYVRKLKNHLGADTRAELVRRADSQGLLD